MVVGGRRRAGWGCGMRVTVDVGDDIWQTACIHVCKSMSIKGGT